MSDEGETSSVEELPSDQQRLDQLERAGKLDRLLIYALAGALLLNLLGWIVVAALGGSAELDEETQAALASRASVELLQKEVAALQLQISPLQQQLKDQQKLILMLSQQQRQPAAQGSEPPQAADTRERDQENVRMLARTLIGQERNYQQTLVALKEGMHELAGMTPGSRSWLGYYEESLAKPMADSQARIKALEKWSGEPTQ